MGYTYARWEFNSAVKKKVAGKWIELRNPQHEVDQVQKDKQTILWAHVGLTLHSVGV